MQQNALKIIFYFISSSLIKLIQFRYSIQRFEVVNGLLHMHNACLSLTTLFIAVYKLFPYALLFIKDLVHGFPYK